jgi:hypothetical protein
MKYTLSIIIYFALNYRWDRQVKMLLNLNKISVYVDKRLAGFSDGLLLLHAVRSKVMSHIYRDEDNFVSDFRALQGRREELVGVLVSSTNRLILNFPGSGLARRIAALLREGPFTDYYEFEKFLARALHPFLAGLNLNIIADILVNSIFSEKYHFYARDINYILASSKEPGIDTLRDVILKMVERDGHYMVVKFCDLVLRPIDAHLSRGLKQAELCLVEMKKNLGGSAAENAEAIGAVYDTYRKNHGETAARLLSRRMQWDQELKNYLQAEKEPPASESEVETGVGAEPHEAEGGRGEDVPWEDRVERYAALIKENYLIKKKPSDEQGIRSIVEGMVVKNERVSGKERAANIVQEVLSLWIDDDALDADMRDVLLKIREERKGIAVSPDGPVQEAVSQEALRQEGLPIHKSETQAEEVDQTDAGALEEEMVMEATQEADEPEPLEAGVSDEEMSAILEGIPDGIPEESASSAESAGREEPEQDDDETFLISEDERSQMAEGTSRPEAGTDDSFLINEEEAAAGKVPGEVRDEAAEMVSADQEFIEEMIAADEFAIQDELLYEDKSLKKKQKTGKKPDDE